jgi:hypothetical protein
MKSAWKQRLLKTTRLVSVYEHETGVIDRDCVGAVRTGMLSSPPVAAKQVNAM